MTGANFTCFYLAGLRCQDRGNRDYSNSQLLGSELSLDRTIARGVLSPVSGLVTRSASAADRQHLLHRSAGQGPGFLTGTVDEKLFVAINLGELRAEIAVDEAADTVALADQGLSGAESSVQALGAYSGYIGHGG